MSKQARATGSLTAASYAVGILSIMEAVWSAGRARMIWVFYDVAIALVALIVLIAVRATVSRPGETHR